MGIDKVEGIEAVYRDQMPQLWRALVAYSGNPEIASDAVAEAFAQAIRRGDDLREPERWVWKVAFLVAAGALKERGRLSPLGPEGSYEMPDEAIALSGLLRRLSPKQRAAVVLHYYADMPNPQIARILGVTVPTVRVHLSQGRQRLKRLMEEHDD